MATALKTVGETSAASIGPHVYQAIAAVQGELATIGIAKTRRNQQGSGYNFRGIDDVYAALSPLLAKHSLVIVPRVISRECIDRQSKSGGNLFYVTVHVEFDFVSAVDGTNHTAATFGEAMDSGDKATNKAMSAAYKYAAFMTFAIPTEGDNDADATTHDVAARAAIAPKPDPTPPVAVITDDQIKIIRDLLPDAGVSEEKLRDGYTVTSLADLTEPQAANAIKRLEKTILAKRPTVEDVLDDEVPY